MKKLIFIFVLLNISFLSVSQNTGVDKFFDDGGISTAKNLVKLNLASLIVGDLSISYERIVSTGFSVELGAGVLLPYYVDEIHNRLLYDNVNEIVNPKSGYSFTISPRFFFFNDAPEAKYIAVQYRMRHYNLEDNVITYNDFSLIYGTQFAIYKKLFLNYSFGCGIRSVNNPKELVNETNNQLQFIIPIEIKLAYLF